ncbi:hypothetical protein IEQ34_023550 [Dendrobium chrysotoxum]|uniref:Uncharacterized protein n=1 Tax=Dendrobium chrysotoxum TaxID=161865 RepID=A0AAV7FUQ4_DENCH|nr:hypothetical protein IEQ34_023550 [Dendrobium chrysotoxum]
MVREALEAKDACYASSFAFAKAKENAPRLRLFSGRGCGYSTSDLLVRDIGWLHSYPNSDGERSAAAPLLFLPLLILLGSRSRISTTRLRITLIYEAISISIVQPLLIIRAPLLLVVLGTCERSKKGWGLYNAFSCGMKLSFFHAGGLKKAAINRISRILPSRKEEREILFRDQEIGSSHNIRRMLGINNSLLGFRPPQSLRALPDQCNGCVSLSIS